MFDSMRTSRELRHREHWVTYHAIDRVKSSSIYNLSCCRFEDHLKMILDLEKCSSHQAERVWITFDDGHTSNLQHAAPLLEKYRKGAIFFVVGGFIGSRPDFMDWAQLRELSDLGYSIQSHTWSHPLLTHCTDQELDEELTRSRRVLEEKLGKAVDALSVPGGRWDARVLRGAARAGYRRVFLSDPAVHRKLLEDVEVYGRLTIKDSMSTASLRKVLTAKGLQSLDFRVRYRAKEVLRKLVGDAAYRRLWSFLGNSGG